MPAITPYIFKHMIQGAKNICDHFKRLSRESSLLAGVAKPLNPRRHPRGSPPWYLQHFFTSPFDTHILAKLCFTGPVLEHAT